MHRSIIAQPPATARFLADVICAVPTEVEALSAESAWLRLTHADLNEMSSPELRRELLRVDLRLILEDEADEADQAWLLDRRQRIIETLEHAHAPARPGR